MRKPKATPVKDDTYEILRAHLQETAKELNMVYTNLENVLDPDLIDLYIYQAKAAQMRYKYLLTSVKKLEDSYTKNPL